uniref:C2H2-type domain-containing protein n=1 Tax=viral metagenome TaxID=1070528 RepID=A0A6M3KQN6_9ZZZZ
MGDKDIIYMCEECGKIFTQEEKEIHDSQGEWGRPCKRHPRSKKPWRCESYLRKYKEVLR